MSKTLIVNNPACSKHTEELEPRESFKEILGELHLSDIIQLKNIQLIQDAFARATDVSSVIVDLDGNLLTSPSNFTEICKLIRQTEKGMKRCSISDKNRRNKSRDISYQCLSCGFTNSSVPIFIGNVQVADWLIGQCNSRGVDREFIEKYAGEIGVDVDQMLAAFDKMPVLPIEEFEKISELLNTITQEFSQMNIYNELLQQEIAAKKIIATRLEISEKSLEEFYNSVVEGICIINEKDTIIFANPALADIYGASSLENIIGKNVLRFFEAGQFEMLNKQKKNCLAGKASKCELKLKNFHGQDINLLLSSNPRFDDKNKYIGTFVSVFDITEQKRLQKYISKAQRLESAGKIAAQVAHDFNNLLGPLVAYPEIIQKHLPKDSPARDLLQDIEKAATLMAEINQQLLTLGRRGHYNLEVININEIILQSLENIKNNIDNIDVELDLASGIMNIKGGGSQLIRVITNLLNNALDAMNNSGHLSIKSENYYADHQNYIDYQIPQGEYIKLSITDNGCGIDPNSLPFIFDPFFTTKKSDIKRGSGLGLSVVHSVVQDHHGYISIDSRLGEGTSVYLYFTLVREALQEDTIDEIYIGTEKILVVDDDIVQRSVTKNLLSDLGYIVKICNSGEAAVHLLKTDHFDLVILDMIMPNGMDGAQTFKEIIKSKPSQKALMISGYTDSTRVHNARELGIGGFIGKPLNVRKIGKAIRNLLDNPQR